MIDRGRWQVYVGIAALFVLTLTLLWFKSSDRNHQHEDLTGSVTQLPLPANEPARMPAEGELRNPFASRGFAEPSSTEPSVKMDALQHEAPVLNQQDKVTDWSQWRKADERTRSYLGGPPGPGKPAE